MKKAIIYLFTFLILGMFFSPVTAKASCEDEVLAEMNAVREQVGLSNLTMDYELQKVATIRAEECSENFSHTRPNGQAWYTVSSLTNGENLAHAVNYNQQKPENVVYAWTLSPKHYANLVRSSYSTVGIAYFSDENGEIYIACEFR